MDRFKVPSGTIQKLETVFDKVQNFVEDNINRRIQKIFASYGTSTDLLYGTVQESTNLKISRSGNSSAFMLESGSALLEIGETITVNAGAQQSLVFSSSSDYDSYYLIYLKHTEVGTAPTPAMNSFLFDKTGSTPYSTKNQEWLDSYTVHSDKIGETDAIVPATDELPLAIIKAGTQSNNGILQTGWSRNSVASVNGVIDLRPTYTLKMNHDLLDDTKIIFKDRDSTGNNKIQGSIESSDTMTAINFIGTDMALSDDLSVEGLTSLKTDQGNILIESSASSTGVTYKPSGVQGAKIDITDSYGYTMNLGSGIDFKTVYFKKNANSIGLGLNVDPTEGADFHIKKTGFGAWPVIRLESESDSDLLNTVKYDIFTRNNDDGAGRLEVKPQTTNWPVEFRDKDGNKVFEINPSTLDVTAYDDFHVTDNLTVGGQIASTGNASIGGNLAVTGRSSLVGNSSIVGTLGVVGATNLNSVVAADLTVTNLFTLGTQNVWIVDVANNRIGVNKVPTKDFDISGDMAIDGTSTLNTVNISTLTATTSNMSQINIPKQAGLGTNDAGFNSDGSLTLGADKTQTSSDYSLRIGSRNTDIGKARIEGTTASELHFSRTHSDDDWVWTTTTEGSQKQYFKLTDDTGDYFIAQQSNGSPLIDIPDLKVSNKLELVDGASLNITGDTFSLTVPNLTVLNSLSMSNVFKVDANGVSIDSSSNLAISGSMTANSLSTNNDITVGGTFSTSNPANISGVYDDNFYVGIGGTTYPNGRAVKLEDPETTLPANLRVYDVFPTDNINETNSLIWVKWNWDALNGTKDSSTGSTIDIAQYNFNGEEFAPVSDDLIGKRFYFTSSGNKYKIIGYDTSTREITVSGNFDVSDSTNESQPGMVIDSNTTGYKFKITRYDGLNSDLSDMKITHELDNSYTTNPSFITKLELGKQWYFAISSFNNDHSSDWLTMVAGAYDPDHAQGGQSPTSYTAPFTNTLPNISAAGTVTSEGTAFGFNLTINGFETLNDSENTAHEYQVAYSTNSGVSFDDDSFSQRVTTEDRMVSISSNTPAQYYYKVRALQNKQPVSGYLTGNVVAGGGGIPPGDQMVVQMPVKMIVASGIISTSPSDPSTFTVSGYNHNGDVYTMGNNEETGNTWEIYDSTGSTSKGTTKINNQNTEIF